MMKTTTFCLALIAGLAIHPTTYAAAITGLVVEGGGTPQVYALNNGNFLGLWGFDNREGANPGAGAVDITSDADILGGFTSGAASIVDFYNGPNPPNAGASEFDPLTYPLTIADDARLFNSVWVEWTGGNIVYQRPSGGTATMGSGNVTLPGDPFIPEPSTALLAGLAAVAGCLRRR